MKNSQKFATMNTQSKEPPNPIVITNLKVGTNKYSEKGQVFEPVKEDCRLSKILKPFKKYRDRYDRVRLLQADNRRLFDLVQEYCRLSKLFKPSERDIDKIAAILELAQYDAELNCLINEADRLIAYELELQSI
ncbi:hypothetical protein [Mastigocoleus testarum]|uniref:Uncharacterized protein n=1 Tax=Mastigocoleus testarum BC008 TaxID=371196 RepID=A0A0V7ZZL9_9CYAN|nr:hypothetical protein [Mastigocoleus testarum]KST69938.1 hypothetical protein BC008_05740 [Mastigocoleus testarum BC008]KST69945.1 hypothetical protein BC008_05770 [Mastigocoleus testarum BC008]